MDRYFAGLDQLCDQGHQREQIARLDLLVSVVPEVTHRRAELKLPGVDLPCEQIASAGSSRELAQVRVVMTAIGNPSASSASTSS
jgi:hypothetical protein